MSALLKEAEALYDAKLADKPTPLDDLNKNHALTLMGDKVVVLRETIGERGGKELQYLSLAAFKAWYMNKTTPVEIKDKDGKTTTKPVPVAELWLKSRERRQYEGVTFAPAGNAPGSYYNLWSGFAVEPLRADAFHAAMKCKRLLSHMKYNLCGGNRGHFRYLLAWAADMVQDPDRKKGVALVMRGEKGVGKSRFAEALSYLLGRHAMKVSHMRHLTGNFNRHLADKLLVVAEESYWAGDKGDEGPLKDMITSDRITIEAKGVDAVEMPSLCRIIMVTNNDWAVPATNDERRYFVLDVGNKRKQDHAYFEAMSAQLERGGHEALLTLLQQFDLSKINLRHVPETDGLRRQRTLSLEPHDQFFYDALCDGFIMGKEWDGPLFLVKDEVFNAYINAARKRGKIHLQSESEFWKRAKKTTGAKARRGGGRYKRFQGVDFHDREVTADLFRKACNVDIDICKEDGYIEPPF